jgi:hypothetical protein
MRKPKMAYADIEDELRTGDIFLARGLRRISRLIEAMCGSKWSHSGMVIRPSDIDMDYPNDEPLLWESTDDDNIPDILTGKPKTGPMLVPLRERIRTDVDTGYYKVFGIRYLQVERTPDMLARLHEVVFDPAVQRARFPTYRSMISETLKERFFGAKQDDGAPKEEYVCAQLLTYTLQSMGLMPLTPVARSYVPKDYSDAGYAPFRHRATLGPEIYLGTKLDPPTPPLLQTLIPR